MKVIVYKQKPRVMTQGVSGELSVDNKQAHLFGPDDLLIMEMLNPELVFINPAGLLLRGFEPNGVDKAGRSKYLYQEWFCKADYDKSG